MDKNLRRFVLINNFYYNLNLSYLKMIMKLIHYILK